MAVFYSFHYDRDAWRVQQIIQMGVVEGQPLLNAQTWEEVYRGGDRAIMNWIETEMKYKTAAVVLVGAETADRPWVIEEIKYAWNNKKPLVGIRINGLLGTSKRPDPQGPNPFQRVRLTSGGTVADKVRLWTPPGATSQDVHRSIRDNLTSLVNSAYRRP